MGLKGYFHLRNAARLSPLARKFRITIFAAVLWTVLLSGSKSLACPTMRSALLRIGSISPSFPDLTDQDLKDLGVVLGDRRKLLRAIAKLDATPQTVTLMPQPASTPSIATEQPVRDGEKSSERHHVTVMFCDLVDSTDIGARLDVEERRDLVDAYLDAVSAAVTEMGGKVVKKFRYGVMALFGYTAAQKNNSERAVRAALATHRALAELNRMNADISGPVIAARIAIELWTGGDRCGRSNFRRGAEHRCASTGTGGTGRGRGHGARTTASRRSVRRQ